MNIKKALFLIFAALLPSLHAATLKNDTHEITSITRGITYASHSNFNELIANGNVVIDFFKGTCGPCGKMNRVIDTVNEDYPNITFVKVDVTANAALANAWGVKATPTLYFRQDGKALEKVVGARSEREFRTIINRLYS